MSGKIKAKVFAVATPLICTLCCLLSTIMFFAIGDKTPGLKEQENKSVLIASKASYVICTIIGFLLIGLAIFAVIKMP